MYLFIVQTRRKHPLVYKVLNHYIMLIHHGVARKSAIHYLRWMTDVITATLFTSIQNERCFTFWIKNTRDFGKYRGLRKSLHWIPMLTQYLAEKAQQPHNLKQRHIYVDVTSTSTRRHNDKTLFWRHVPAGRCHSSYTEPLLIRNAAISSKISCN